MYVKVKHRNYYYIRMYITHIEKPFYLIFDLHFIYERIPIGTSAIIFCCNFIKG